MVDEIKEKASAVEEKFWYRSAMQGSFGEWKELPASMKDSHVLLWKTSTGEVFCPIHCKWESFTFKSEFSCTCGRGIDLKGFLVPLFDGNADNKKSDKGVIIISKVKEKPVYISECDSEEISYDIFLFSTCLDMEKRILSIKRKEIDRKKFFSYKEGSFECAKLPTNIYREFFYFSGIKKSDGSIYYSDFYANNYSGQLNLPPIVFKSIENSTQRLVNYMAGRKIRLNKGYFSGLDLVSALANFPYEANLFALEKMNAIDLSVDEKKAIREDFDGFNSICQKYGFKSFPFLRKKFDEYPKSFKYFRCMREIGFKDLNVIMRVMEPTFCEGDKKNICNSFDFVSDFEIDLASLKFFCSKSIPTRGEICTLNALVKDAEIGTYEWNDTLRMFKSLYDELRPEEVSLVLKEGINSRNHEMLSKIDFAMKNKNIEFKYNSAQKSLEDEIDGYKFMLPPDSSTLHTIGASMYNCVYSYRNSVLSGDCTIIYAKKDYSFEICIEVRPGGLVWQARGMRNSSVTGEAKVVFKNWMQKHGLHL